MSEAQHQGPAVAKIPADVDQPDRLVLGLTARQAGILAATAVVLYLLFQATHPLVPPLMFGPISAVVLAVTVVAVTVRRDGLSLDRLGAAAIRHAARPRRQVFAPEGVEPPPAFLADATARRSAPAPFESPVRQVAEDGVVDLGRDGASVLASCSTLNFALRTPAEQEVLIGGFARWLNALTGSVQISTASAPVDVSSRIATLRVAARSLPHPALEAAAREHADFLAGLSARGQLLDRSILLAVHENDARSAPRLARRISEAAAHLATCEIELRPLGAADAEATITAALSPEVRPTTEEGI